MECTAAFTHYGEEHTPVNSVTVEKAAFEKPFLDPETLTAYQGWDTGRKYNRNKQHLEPECTQMLKSLSRRTSPEHMKLTHTMKRESNVDSEWRYGTKLNRGKVW